MSKGFSDHSDRGDPAADRADGKRAKRPGLRAGDVLEASSQAEPDRPETDEKGIGAVELGDHPLKDSILDMGRSLKAKLQDAPAGPPPVLMAETPVLDPREGKSLLLKGRVEKSERLAALEKNVKSPKAGKHEKTGKADKVKTSAHKEDAVGSDHKPGTVDQAERSASSPEDSRPHGDGGDDRVRLGRSDDGARPDVEAPPEAGSEGGHGEDLLSRLSQLPPETQMQILGSAMTTFGSAAMKNGGEILGGLVRGTQLGLADVGKDLDQSVRMLQELAQFGQDLVENNPRALETSAGAGKALGKCIGSGLHLFSLADRYLYDMGFSGDYGKPFQDMAWLGQELDRRWERLSPGQQSELTARLGTRVLSGMVAELALGKLGRGEKVTHTLEELADASAKGGAGFREQTGKFVEELMDELMQVDPGVIRDDA